MKKTALLFLLWGLPLLLSAYEIKPRIGAFFPVDHLFEDIYGSIGPSYEIEATADLSADIVAWGNLNFDNMQGSSLGAGDSTSIFLVNTSFGLKLKYTFKSLKLYGGLGCVLSDIIIDNDNTSCCKHTSKFAAGGVIKVGAQRSITKSLFLDYFVDYYIQPVSFDTQRDVGGLRTGLGLGYLF